MRSKGSVYSGNKERKNKHLEDWNFGNPLGFGLTNRHQKNVSKINLTVPCRLNATEQIQFFRNYES
mgnify:CR=1 FL=1